MKQRITKKGLLITILCTSMMAVGLLAMMAKPVHADTVITSLDITGITMPKEGEHPTFSGISVNTPNVNFEESLSYWWFKRADEFTQKVQKDEYFEDGLPYSITFAITPKPGYTFSENVQMTAMGTGLTNVEYRKDYGNILYGEFYCGQAEPLSPSSAGEVYYTNTETEMYSSRSRYSMPLSHLKDGVMVESYACLNDWVGVAIGGMQGWIHRDDLSVIYDPASARAMYAKVESGAVNVREGIPGDPKTERIGSLSSGDRILTTGMRTDSAGADWYVIDYNRQMAFVMAGYLTPSYDYFMSLSIKSLPVFITAKNDASPPILKNGSDLDPKDANIIGLSDGTIKIKAVPDAGDSFAMLELHYIHLPSGSGWVLKNMTFDPSDQSATVILQNEWSYNTGKKMKVLSPKLKAGKKKVTVSWSKDPNASGYHVRYSYKSNMEGAKLKVVKGRKKTKLVIKKLKKGKKVYVQVRPYVTYGGRTFNGLLNKAKSVKVK